MLAGGQAELNWLQNEAMLVSGNQNRIRPLMNRYQGAGGQLAGAHALHAEVHQRAVPAPASRFRIGKMLLNT